MIVVADTTPLNYLVLIDQIDLLPALYKSVLIPSEVHSELLATRAPEAVRLWAAALPPWCAVAQTTPTQHLYLDNLDPGERAAIQLALNSGIDTVLIDDLLGRRAAERHHLQVTGTISILEEAAKLKLIDFRAAFARLENTNFRLARKVRDQFLERNP